MWISTDDSCFQPPQARGWGLRPLAAGMLGLAALLAGAQGWTAQEDLDEVARLLEQGRAAQAARLAESHLQRNPGDVQMRFLQGVIATEQGQNAKAIEVFTALTRDYPNLPEPYNNLAVLYAAEGQERKASEVLEQAIRTNPSYATAHENLGDLYARMASEAYAKALQLDDSRKTAQPKLALITQIFPLRETGAATPPAAAAARVAAASQARPQEPADASPQLTTVPEPAPKPAVAAAPAAPPQAPARPVAPPATSAAALAAAPVRETPPPVASPTSSIAAADAVASSPREASTGAASASAGDAKNAAADREAVQSAVQAWAAAWASQDIDAYLGAYSEQFRPGDGSSLSNWQAQRRQRIVGRPPISVTVREMKVSLDGDQATAAFRQAYASGAYRATTRKTLRLQREGAQWRIVEERAGS
ncbi:tetratricopeptide repeat protein [Corticibacter populi]|uniref:Tetratricopeptide repeat protein n=1 Tax=Corticibacter populi TaxID=1550736 RepID=A0A3M6QGP0_9BURK|nr:tetratricopeptide repeat protein [Corticibacter populi]RMX02217.1 tetratricopeptide repeat protein [Corticibacter populi]RZS29515.1 SnoaL-like protein [Corticibacter populi]